MKHQTLMRRWADATRRYRWAEADELWRHLMEQWLTPTVVDQDYWNRLLDRRMAVLERREQREKISDDEWDKTHGDFNQ